VRVLTAILAAAHVQVPTVLFPQPKWARVQCNAATAIHLAIFGRLVTMDQ